MKTTTIAINVESIKLAKAYCAIKEITVGNYISNLIKRDLRFFEKIIRRYNK